MKVKYVDYEQYKGWYSEELINHFENGFAFNKDDCETVGDFARLVREHLATLDSFADSSFPGDRAILMKSDDVKIRFFLDEKSSAPFSDLLGYFGITDEIELSVNLVTGGLGEVFHSEGCKLGVIFLFHSNEGNHLGRPHVHVTDINNYAEISVDLDTLKTMKHANTKSKTKFSGKKLKQTLQFIEDHKNQFRKYWNDTTNGFEIEIDS